MLGAVEDACQSVKHKETEFWQQQHHHHQQNYTIRSLFQPSKFVL